MKKQLKVSLRVTVFFMILAIAGILQSIPGADWGTKAQAASYSGDYRYWSQGASDDYNMRQMAAGSRHRQNFYMRQMLTEVPVLIRIVI